MSSETKEDAEERRSIRNNILFSTALIVVVFGGLVAWGSFQTLAGAIIAPGQVVVETFSRPVQHQAGGIVFEAFVRDGDRVREGQPLMRIDESVVAAERQAVDSESIQLTARTARLEAERVGGARVDWPDELTRRRDEPDVSQRIAAEQRLFDTRRSAHVSRVARSQERLVQLSREIEGLEARRSVASRNIASLEDELRGLRHLLAQTLVQRGRVTILEREVHNQQGELAQATASIARARASMEETNREIEQIRQEFQSEIGQSMTEASVRLAALRSRAVALEDRMARGIVTAPVAGVVQRLAARSRGMVVPPGGLVAEIVPAEDSLRVEARVAPTDRDTVILDQRVRVRFSAFHHGTTPEIYGTVKRISPDVVRSENPQVLPYYEVKVALEPSEIARLGQGRALVTGMPAEVFLLTPDRTVMSYLFKPLLDQMQRVFREPID